MHGSACKTLFDQLPASKHSIQTFDVQPVAGTSVMHAAGTQRRLSPAGRRRAPAATCTLLEKPFASESPQAFGGHKAARPSSDLIRSLIMPASSSALCLLPCLSLTFPPLSLSFLLATGAASLTGAVNTLLVTVSGVVQWGVSGSESAASAVGFFHSFVLERSATPDASGKRMHHIISASMRTRFTEEIDDNGRQVVRKKRTYGR